MPKLKPVVVLLLLCFSQIATEDERSFLDNFIGPFRMVRRLLQNVLISNKSNSNSERLQEVSSDSVKFPCDLKNARSPQRPESVHKLRPGDIDVIGAIGDSLTAGYGLTATNVMEVLLEERGKAFSGGGEGTWKDYLTLPNILKMFNPNLIGYATKTCLSIERESQLNVAEGGAISQNMVFMTKQLIRRMLSNRQINVSLDWKMVTIFIGANDACSEICYLRNPLSSLEKHKNDMIQVLRLLKNYLPRTIVNFIPAIHLKLLVDLKLNSFCNMVHLVECPCLFGLPNASKKPLMYEIMARWQQIDVDLGNNPEFDSNDFTVVVQPVTINYTVVEGFNESFLSEDCFHFAQKLNALVANDLWNDIMEPVGHKSSGGKHFLFQKFNCPTDDHPYIFTRRNS